MSYTSSHREEILDQYIFFKSTHKLALDSNNPYFYCIPPKKITGKFTIIRGICKFSQPGLISSMKYEEKLSHTNLNPKRIYLYIMDLIFNDWKHIFRNETYQRPLFKPLRQQPMH